MKVGSLFSGIGGFDLGLERAGMEIVWQVEIDPFCNKVLAKHWPEVKRYGDIRDVGKHNLEPVDLICGGFPCQPFSTAGKRRGKEDDRFLWPEMLRVISEVRPRWIIGENVAGIINMELDNCISDLEREGYEVQTFVIPACAVGAPHRRDRVWIVAHRKGTGAGSDKGGIRDFPIGENRGQTTDSDAPDTRCIGQEKQEQQTTGGKQYNSHAWNTESTGQQGSIVRPWEVQHGGTGSGSNWLEVATRLCRVAHGVPNRVDRLNRLKCLGNAVVPQIVEILGWAIMAIDSPISPQTGVEI